MDVFHHLIIAFGDFPNIFVLENVTRGVYHASELEFAFCVDLAGFFVSYSDYIPIIDNHK